MKALVIVCMLASSALAAPIVPPAGWELDNTLATPPVAQRFNNATTRVTVYAYRAPVAGAVLYVNRADADIAGDRDRIATTELDEPRNAMRRQGANAKAEQDTQRYDAAKKQLEAAVTWRDATVGVSDSSRVVIAADERRMVAVTGQCVLAIDAPADLVKTCETALATLDPEVPAETRVPLAIVGNTAEPPPKPTHDVIDDGGKMNLPPIRVDPPKSEPDRRPVYLGLGIVVLAAVFWWNRRNREKFERENPPEAPKTDEDAQDLHAAAEAGDDEDKK